MKPKPVMKGMMAKRVYGLTSMPTVVMLTVPRPRAIASVIVVRRIVSHQFIEVRTSH
jgi:hypothetical protein